MSRIVVDTGRRKILRAETREVHSQEKGMRKLSIVAVGIVIAVGLTASGQTPQPQTNPTNLGSDPNGNPLRKALKTGHVSNYDESKVAPYTLPDPLVMANGQR